MDINYILAREQYALHMAKTSPSLSARVAHRAFAKAYGLILAASHFPHNALQTEKERGALRKRCCEDELRVESWENEGGRIRPPRPWKRLSENQNQLPRLRYSAFAVADEPLVEDFAKAPAARYSVEAIIVAKKGASLAEGSSQEPWLTIGNRLEEPDLSPSDMTEARSSELVQL